MQIRDFKKQYSGRICFILGAGPSLRDLNVDMIKDHVCITVNSGVVKYPDCDIFVSDDQDIKGWSYYDIIKKSSCNKFLYKNKFENKSADLKNVTLFEHKHWFSPENKSYDLDGLRLTKDEPIVGARLSMGSASHIAYILGCNPIVLLGNDCKLSSSNLRYFWQYPGENKQFRVSGRQFTHQTQNRGFSQDSFVEYWNYFAKVNQNIIGKEVDIIDASDSCLECFPKMSVKKILEKYGDKV